MAVLVGRDWRAHIRRKNRCGGNDDGDDGDDDGMMMMMVVMMMMIMVMMVMMMVIVMMMMMIHAAFKKYVFMTSRQTRSFGLQGLATFYVKCCVVVCNSARWYSSLF
jgi:hypothetical protein